MYDNEFEVRHDEDGWLTATCTKYVDDLKLGGVKPVLFMEIVPAPEEVFGKLKYNEFKFTNSGVRHPQRIDGRIPMDQDGYIDVLKPIGHP